MIKGNLEKIAKLLKRGHLARLSVDEIAELIKRSNGKCYLCNENLNFEKEIKKIEGDKKDPSETLSIENLYLAHEQCNNDKKDQPVSLARIKIAFKKFYEKKDEFITFDEFLDEYVENNRKSIKVKTLKDKLVLKFRDEETILPFFTDPTTKVKYCFGEISISYLFNDKDVQPRPIDKTHLFKLVDDFQSHPVHEPSNCRLITKKELNENYIDAELLQFDGQHKSAAQVLLGREFLPFKIYINPEIKMIRELVVIIQNEIKKKAVLESIIIKRMKAAYQDRWNGYLELSGEHSEAGLIDSLPAREKNLAKKELKNAIYDNIIENSRLKLTEFLSKGKTKGERKRPVSINLLKQILDSFLYTKPSNLALETKKDVREIEAENVVFFLNIIYNSIFADLTPKEKKKVDLLPDRIIRIWKSGSVKFWTNILKNVINYQLSNIDEEDKEKPFQKKIEENRWNQIRKTSDRLFAHSVWGKADPTLDKVLNANDLKAAKREFEKRGLDTDYLIK